MNLADYIKDVPDYPKPGIIFKDITPLLSDKDAFKFMIDQFAEKYRDKNIDVVVGIDARGFIMAAPVAYQLGVGLAIVRKPGKLPRNCISEDYILEYASNTLQMHDDAIREGQNVLIIDDVLATGGTMEATCKMVEKLGGKVAGIGFLVELEFLKGKEKLEDYKIEPLIHYS